MDKAETRKVYQTIKQHAEQLSVAAYVYDGFANEFEDIERATYIDYETRDRTSARISDNRRKKIATQMYYHMKILELYCVMEVQITSTRIILGKENQMKLHT